MKKGLLFLVFACASIVSFATHIAAGELYYVYEGPGAAANTSRYKITMKLFRDCSSVGQDLNAEGVTIGIYNNPALSRHTTLSLTKQWTGAVPSIQNTNGANPCLSPFVSICYHVGTFSNSIDLPNTPGGYTLAWVRFTRTALENVVAGGFIGATFITQIPGTTQLPSGTNNSAQFVTKDTSTICKNTSFSIDFSATDSNGDSLSYAFTSAYDGTPDPANPTNPSPPPPLTLSLPSLNYTTGYSGAAPLGPGVTINPQTGIISGVAPTVPDYYVICVVVSEWRGGVRINQHRKDFILKVGDCSMTGAELAPSYITCDGFSWTFQNESTSPGITGYTWNFGDPGSGANNTSSTAAPSHTFSDTGKFKVKLTVTNTGGCQDSAITIMSVYPAFKSDFTVTGNCFQSPFNFQDATTSTYGTVNGWRWNFGETTVTDDTSILKNPSYQYPNAGTRTVILISSNDKGCIDTISKPVDVRANPVLTLPFKDTLICSIDTLPLIAQGTGNFTWTSSPVDPTLTAPNSPNPQVAPKDTTMYIVTLNENGCLKSDTIIVNVLDFIDVELGLDTGICRTDTIIMKPVTHALSFLWTPATGLSSTTAKNPQAYPLTTTKYYLSANLGKCQDRDSITIFVAPYPSANAGNGDTICYGSTTQLSATYAGTGFAWSPTNTLVNPNSLTPIAGPMQTTPYIFTAFSAGICPKPRSDTAWVVVMPPVNAFAGNDTTVTAMQPLQLAASGGVSYTWGPSTGLSATNINNPIATLPPTIDSIIYRVRVSDAAGCSAEDDVKVIVFKTGPDIFIPTAFTPNGDGRNEIARPVLVGMQTLTYFRIYNRWGQMVYSTSEIGKGWDGKFGGTPQPSGTYVFSAQAVDYTGKVVVKKGTVVLIR